ncbi:MAG: hypothetical protein GY801_29060, partial [bacterium]|nr:hypothetical protein [bacterium]
MANKTNVQKTWESMRLVFEKWGAYLVWIAIIIYAVGITFAMQRQYFNGRMLLCDHALNEQALWSALHGHGFFSECAIT